MIQITRAAVVEWVRHMSLITRVMRSNPASRSRLEGSQCHPPPRGGTGCGKMDDISPSHTVGPELSRPGANKNNEMASAACILVTVLVQCLVFCSINNYFISFRINLTIFLSLTFYKYASAHIICFAYT